MKKYLLNYDVRLGERDVILASFPRSGSYWLSCLLAFAIIETEGFAIRHCKKNIKKLIPRDRALFEGRYEELGLKFRCFPRIIKTHGLFLKKYKKTVYMIRDPRDVMTSFYYFRKYHVGKDMTLGSLSEFIRNELDGWCLNVKSWKNKSDMVLVYEDMLKDIDKEIRKLFDFLEIRLDGDLLKRMVRKCAFDRAQKEEIGGYVKKFGKKPDIKSLKVRKGGSGDWKRHFSKEDQAFLSEKIKEHGLEKFLGNIGYSFETQRIDGEF